MINSTDKNLRHSVKIDKMQALKSQIGASLVLILLVVVLSVFVNGFATIGNAEDILRTVSFVGIIAAGQTLVILTGGIDLSVGSMVGLTGCIAAGLITGFKGPHVSPEIGLVMGILAGTAFGTVNGILVSYLRMPPFIVTLAAMMAARGLAEVYTEGQTLSGLPPTWYRLFAGEINVGPFSLPVIALVMLAVFAVLSVVTARTEFGRNIYAVGGNEEASRLSGVSVGRVKLYSYAIAGTLSGLAGALLIFRLHGGISTNGDQYELDAIAACVIGGTSLTGGVGTVAGTLIGILITGCVRSGLNLAGVDSNWQRVIIGLIILVAVGIDMVRKQRQFKTT
ncbi:MAG: ABC transporter permease [Armatimonadota bacterium]